MTPLPAGTVVRCTGKSGWSSITVGKEYTLCEDSFVSDIVNAPLIKIVDDDGDRWAYPLRLFEPVVPLVTGSLATDLLNLLTQTS